MPPYGGPCVTPVPESPHCSSLSLPDLDEAPSSPHSPHTALPELDGLFAEPSAPTLETISPSLLGGAPDLEDSLRLDMQPLSDPAFVRSPSPGDEDDFGFLDVQFDADATPAEAEEFCRLRSIRKTAQAQERAARAAEAELGERIQTVATSLLPPTRTEAPLNSSPPPTDPDCMQTDEPPPDTPGPSACFSTAPDVRARKRELQVLTEKRADARRARKAAKHRGKEVGALLELKTHTSAAAFAFLPVAGLPPPGAKGWTRSLAHLIAHMIFRRRERARPLENRLGALCADGSRPPLVRRPSRLGLVRDACAPGELEDEGGRAEDDGMVM
ncbi:uncharacterized protein BXZ73DRAFT_50933 [Epithele typhae]|uniref:uncharacterized protein n=1 Tax=Epithele typhae TaxID=378194 RepID=UPI0020085C72|nr:uncharacterized protein BXZ73DRAFT_50933 [Epithele typhae]KAH9923705.1 hypothetical protein BXZ73DRAFT_50933 [Epithele typhae]